MVDKLWYEKEREPIKPPEKTVDIPPGLMVDCKKCEARLAKKELLENWWVCPKCDHHHRMPALEWHQLLFDDGSIEIVDSPLYATNPLEFVDSQKYDDRLTAAKKNTELDDACVNARGLIDGHPAVCSALDFFFMGGSMGSVVGEKVTRGAERALKERIPFITVSCSGGARMQEGMYSLMQLVKTSYACGRLREAGIPFISILSDPSTAGVMASFASLGDIIVAEQNALIGFAGPRVIAQTIGGELPDGFQRADFCKKHGQVDIVLHRHAMRSTIGRLIAMFADNAKYNAKYRKE